MILFVSQFLHTIQQGSWDGLSDTHLIYDETEIQRRVGG